MDHHTRDLCVAGVIAALYAGLTLALSAISFGPVQFRVAEAMTLLPAICAPAMPGLIIGCFVANLLGGAPAVDVIFGTLATALACLGVRKAPGNLWMKALWPVLCNGVIVGLVLTFGYGIPTWGLNMLSVAAGEAVVCYVLGVPLTLGLKKSGIMGE